MKLIIHIGTHKTATTTVQATLARNRASLRRAGIWYPAYPEVLPGVAGHDAHLDVAKGLMSESKKLSREQVARFFDELHRQATAAGDIDIVLLSAEPFYRGQADGEGPYWSRRERYIRELRSLIPFEEAEVAIVLRRQDDYLESLYNEHIKVTRYSRNIWKFFDDYRSRFEYREQIEAWTAQFPVIKVATFEDLTSAASVTARFLDTVVGSHDLRLEDVDERRNVSLPIDLIEFKRHLNATSLDRSELSAIVPALQAVARARTGPGRDRRSHLSEADCRKVLAEFIEGNRWINDRFFASRPEGLFPAEIGPRQTVEPLDMDAWIGITAELLRAQRAAPQPPPTADVRDTSPTGTMAAPGRPRQSWFRRNRAR